MLCGFHWVCCRFVSGRLSVFCTQSEGSRLGLAISSIFYLISASWLWKSTLGPAWLPPSLLEPERTNHETSAGWRRLSMAALVPSEYRYQPTTVSFCPSLLLSVLPLPVGTRVKIMNQLKNHSCLRWAEACCCLWATRFLHVPPTWQRLAACHSGSNQPSVPGTGCIHPMTRTSTVERKLLLTSSCVTAEPAA